MAENRILPPSPPETAEDRDYRLAVRWSLALHATFIAVVVFKSLVFPGKPLSYTPTLRVDIVGLPDVLKKDLPGMPKASSAELEAIKKTLDRVDQELKKAKAKPVAPKEPAEKAAPDELVVKPKSAGEAVNRKKKLQNALARIKALEKITSQAETPKPGVLIKGNMISKGTSLSGDARESAEASYFDSVRDRLQQNWALPVWLARQNFSAQVQIFLDARGQLRNFRFLKPSGNAQFDSAVKQTLTESAPYPAPPEALAGNVLVDGILIGFPL